MEHNMAKKNKKQATTTKASKPTRKTTPKEELCVFAIRLTEAERDAIHKAAGPRRATRFVRSLAVAAARSDMKGIQRVLREAREARG